MTNKIKICAIQLCSGLDVAKNLEIIEKLVKQASKKGAQYILTPEMALGYASNRQELEKIAKPYNNNSDIAKCAKIAKQNNIFLHIGSMAIRLKNNYFANRSILLSPKGEIIAFYDKIHLFDANPPNDKPYRESDNYQAGNKITIARLNEVNIGFSICYDLRFSALFRSLAQKGAHIIAAPAAFTVPTGKAHWEILLRARAIETGCFIIASAQGGNHENNRQTWGHSMIIDGWGNIIKMLENDKIGYIMSDVDVGEVKNFRQLIPSLKNNVDFC